MRSAIRRWKYIFIGVSGTLLLQAAVMLLFLRYIGAHLAWEEKIAPADVILALAGDSCDFHRTKLAVQLHRQGYAPKVVLSSNSYTIEDQTTAARRWGLADSNRVFILECASTYEEAVSLEPLARQNGWNSLLVVTDRYHTLRARNVFRQQLPGVRVQVTEAINSTYDQQRYWRKEGSLDAVFHETVKSIYYWYTYGIEPW